MTQSPEQPQPDRPHGDPLGDLLPDGTSDEDASGWSDEPDDQDEALRRQVPPHHG